MREASARQRARRIRVAGTGESWLGGTSRTSRHFAVRRCGAGLKETAKSAKCAEMTDSRERDRANAVQRARDQVVDVHARFFLLDALERGAGGRLLGPEDVAQLRPLRDV